MTSRNSDLAVLVDAIDGAIRPATDVRSAADLAADAVRPCLPAVTEVLTPGELAGDPAGYITHTLYASEDFSIVAAVFLPGQATPIHDHVTWCVVGVLQGIEHETIYRLTDGEPVAVQVNDNPVGSVTGFAPPGDVHRVVNVLDDTTVSMHVYGTNIDRVGSSVRRVYAPGATEDVSGTRS